MSRRVVIGSVLGLAVLIAVIGVLVSGRDSGGDLAVGGVDKDLESNPAPDTTTTPDTHLETTTTSESEEDTDSYSDDADSNIDLPDYLIDDGEENGDTDFQYPDSCDTAWIPSEIFGNPAADNPAEFLPDHDDPNLLMESIYNSALTFEEMVICSDVIIVGEVGEIVATEYPVRNILQEPENTEDELVIPDSERTFIDSYRTAFHQIDVQETLKGNPDTPFILSRSDMSFMGVLDPGSRILLFAYDEPDPYLETNQVQTFYNTFPFDYGLYILDDNDRAYKFPDSYDVDFEAEPEDHADTDDLFGDGSYDKSEPPIPEHPDGPIPNTPPVLESEHEVYHQDETGEYYLDLGELRDQVIPSLISSDPHLLYPPIAELTPDSAETLPHNEGYIPPNIEERWEEGEGIRCRIDIAYTLEEMLEYSDVVVVGEVGEVVTTKFRQQFIDQEQQEEGSYLTEAEIAAQFADLIVIEDFETLKGKPVDPFVFIREDSGDPPWPFFHPKLTAGDRIMLFAYEGTSATNHIPYYITFAYYNGIYILDDEDRAYQLIGDCFANDYEAWGPNYEPVISPPIRESDKEYYHPDDDGRYYLDIADLRDRIILGFEGLP